MGSSYSIDDFYYLHCKQLNILPIKFRIDFHALKTLHLIVNDFSCVKLPNYLRFFSGSTRLRSTHLDHLCLVTDISPRGISLPNYGKGFASSFFYRAHLMWNRLPLRLREIKRPGLFKVELIKHIWNLFGRK